MSNRHFAFHTATAFAVALSASVATGQSTWVPGVRFQESAVRVLGNHLGSTPGIAIHVADIAGIEPVKGLGVFWKY